MLANTSVTDVMTHSLFTVSPTQTLDEIEQIFNTNYIHHLPVVDARGRLLGILSKVDLAKATQLLTALPGKRLHPVLARDIMTTPVITISPEVSLERAAGLFLDNLFHALPVMQDKQLVGIITAHDVLKYVITTASTPD